MADRNHIRPAIVRGSLVHQAKHEAQVCTCTHTPYERMEDRTCPVHVRQAAPSELDVLRHELARARAEAKVYKDSADHWREQACANAQEVGRLQYRLRQLQGGAK